MAGLQRNADFTVGFETTDARAVPGYVWAGPTFAQLDMGWESYIADDERTIWIDDVVISQTQVGCPDPAAAASNPSSNDAPAAVISRVRYNGYSGSSTLPLSTGDPGSSLQLVDPRRDPAARGWGGLPVR